MPRTRKPLLVPSFATYTSELVRHVAAEHERAAGRVVDDLQALVNQVRDSVDRLRLGAAPSTGGPPAREIARLVLAQHRVTEARMRAELKEEVREVRRALRQLERQVERRARAPRRPPIPRRRGVHRPSPRLQKKIERLALLAPRQRQIFLLLIQARSNQEIAKRLRISERTVETVRWAVYRKLRVRNLVEAVVIAAHAGLV